MPTAAVRFTALTDALLNTASTPAQRDRLASGLARRYGLKAEYDGEDAAGKAQIGIHCARRLMIDTVRESEAAAAAQTAASAVDAALPEAP